MGYLMMSKKKSVGGKVKNGLFNDEQKKDSDIHVRKG